ncbi:hypothetical protein E3J62_07350 [candidate division TA06 bacterium]|uniref:DNA binding HTH domain-containing protein n=1 Tax=candidate division TA06 bacterium TaxID=2250710 RepID=A0A523USP5_UNCT6|nr:MAG: hypothetical protein E3J62_07350 [candidate division TA06 bacterium]
MATMKHSCLFTRDIPIQVLKEILTPVVIRVREAEEEKVYQLLMTALDHCLVEYALQTEGNQLAAAKFLGVSRNTLRRKMRKYNVTSARQVLRAGLRIGHPVG